MYISVQAFVVFDDRHCFLRSNCEVNDYRRVRIKSEAPCFFKLFGNFSSFSNIFWIYIEPK
jgi:hypothetical protein